MIHLANIHLPEAILRFRQGFGRLIRTQSDRGVVAIFDRRIHVETLWPDVHGFTSNLHNKSCSGERITPTCCQMVKYVILLWIEMINRYRLGGSDLLHHHMIFYKKLITYFHNAFDQIQPDSLAIESRL